MIFQNIHNYHNKMYPIPSYPCIIINPTPTKDISTTHVLPMMTAPPCITLSALRMTHACAPLTTSIRMTSLRAMDVRIT